MSDKQNKFDRCLYFSANALSRETEKLADDEFAKTGLAPSHAFLLIAVIDKPGIQPMEISRILMLSPSTITRFVEKLELQGLVQRTVSGKNTAVSATEKGISLKPALMESWASLTIRYTDILGKEKSKKLTARIFKSAVKLAAKNIR